MSVKLADNARSPALLMLYLPHGIRHGTNSLGAIRQIRSGATYVNFQSICADKVCTSMLRSMKKDAISVSEPDSMCVVE